APAAPARWFAAAAALRSGRPSWFRRPSVVRPGRLVTARAGRGRHATPGTRGFRQEVQGLATFVTPPCARNVDGPKTPAIGVVFGPSTWGRLEVRTEGAQIGEEA